MNARQGRTPLGAMYRTPLGALGQGGAPPVTDFYIVTGGWSLAGTDVAAPNDYIYQTTPTCGGGSLTSGGNGYRISECVFLDFSVGTGTVMPTQQDMYTYTIINDGTGDRFRPDEWAPYVCFTPISPAQSVAADGPPPRPDRMISGTGDPDMSGPGNITFQFFTAQGGPVPDYPAPTFFTAYPPGKVPP